MDVASWLRKRWVRNSLIGVAVVLVAYGGYAGFARYSNGTTTDVFIQAGTNPDGSMYFRCDARQSSPSACAGPADHATIHVGHRDRVHLTVHSFDGGSRAHDFKMTGFAYGPLYPWVELELQQDTESTTFTAWKSGTFTFFCELGAHRDRGMWGTFEVA